MIPPMSPTSVFDQAHSEFSQRSSSGREINNNDNRNHESDTSPSHHNRRLDRMYKAARREAEIQHAEKQRMRNHNPSRATTKKPKKTKRQASNIKSAEICREAKRIYIERLENAILEEENKCLALTGNMLDLIAERVEQGQRIKRLEETSTNMEQAGLLMSKSCGEAGEVDTMGCGLFVESSIEDEMTEWQFENQSMSYVSHFEEDVERLISSDDDAVTVVTAPYYVEDRTVAPPKDEKTVSVECGFTRRIGSPVSVFDVVRQEGDDNFIQP